MAIRSDNVLNARTIFEFEQSAADRAGEGVSLSQRAEEQPVVFHEQKEPRSI